ncbi:MAG: hypothetical protein NZ879_04880 [Archaeoglobaceae archaeon]|nr:hypothetical protein [Archaeoglobaceae archaeon]MDW8118299.1 hypothetical protein [Archaeoglobaceae archaeon]
MQLSKDYDVSLKKRYGELLLEVKKAKQDYTINLVLLLATIATTTLFSSMFYEDGSILGGLAFSLALFFVLGSHELCSLFHCKKMGHEDIASIFHPISNDHWHPRGGDKV